jgi:hypothetical protein
MSVDERQRLRLILRPYDLEGHGFIREGKFGRLLLTRTDS